MSVEEEIKDLRRIVNNIRDGVYARIDEIEKRLTKLEKDFDGHTHQAML